MDKKFSIYLETLCAILWFNTFLILISLPIMANSLTTKALPQISQKNIFTEEPIADLKDLPQKVIGILPNSAVHEGWITQENNFEKYMQAYFQPWQKSSIREHKDIILKAFSPKSPRYGEDFAVRPQSWYSELLENANMEQLEALKQKAIVINNTYLRTLPTLYPAYINPHQAGEGYPFDTIQDNLLHIGEPVLISHYSKDGKFALLETNAQGYGFVSSQDIAWVDDEMAGYMRKQKYAMVIKENLNLYGDNEEFLQTLYFSTFLPISQEDKQISKILLPVKNDANYVRLLPVKVEQSDFIGSPLNFNTSNAAKVIDILIDRPYGWGGYLMHRDCAQILQDYFAVFGLHIPIYSGNQIKTGNYISLENMSTSEKLAAIKKQAVPWQTILYRKGHVTLYLGEYEGKLLMFHAVWGVHLYDEDDNEYRHIIGKSAITTLEYGKELPGFDEKRSSFLNLLSGMTILQQ
jgi:hypothetical protein